MNNNYNPGKLKFKSFRGSLFITKFHNKACGNAEVIALTLLGFLHLRKFIDIMKKNNYQDVIV